MIMCSICGTWMIRKYVTDKAGMVCYYYDYCPKCNPLAPEQEGRLEKGGTMNKNWRPENWAHIRSTLLERNPPIPPHYKTRQRDFEIGADAMYLADREKLGIMAFLLDEDTDENKYSYY